MKNENFLGVNPSYWIFIIGILLTEAIILGFLIFTLHHYKISEIMNEVNKEVNTLQTDINWQEKDVNVLKRILRNWAHMHNDIIAKVSYRLSGSDSVQLIFQKSEPSDHIFKVQKQFYPGNLTAKVFIDVDLFEAYYLLKFHILTFLIILIFSTIVLVYITQEITRRKYFQKALKKSNAELQQKVDELIKEAEERRHMSEILRENEHYYRTLLNNMQENLMVINEDYKILDVNESLLQTTSFKREEILGRHCYEISHHYPQPCDTFDEVCPLPEVLEKGKTINVLHEHTCKDGTKMWMDLVFSPLRDKSGKVNAVLESARNVTRLIQTQEHLRKLSTAMEQSPVMVMITDVNGIIEFVNPKFCEITGYSAEEVIGKTPRILRSEQHDEAFYREMWNTILDGNVWRGQICNKKKNGELFWEEATIGPIKDEDGKITHFVSVKLDITEKKRLEEQLAQSHKLEGIGQLAGGIAHDFNNILTAIKGYAELAKLRISKEERAYRDITLILESAKRAERLVQQLLTFSRKQIIQPKILDVNESIKGLYKLLNRMIGEDIEIKMSLAPNIAPIKADPVQLEQILINLFVNARDAINQKTDRASEKLIEIETRQIYVDQLLARRHMGLQQGNYVVISVTDNGIGMDQKTMKRIFEPFFTTKEVGKGTGLGLSTVYGIIQQNKGSITVYSEPGKGTTFKIFWPVVEEYQTVVDNNGENGELTGGNETILVVEDDEKVRNIAKEILTQFGYQVIEAANGLQAYNLIKKKKVKIDLLLTDLIMPKMNGRELAEKLQPLYPDLKIIYCSGYTDGQITNELGADHINFLSKPFSTEGLLRKVREVLDQK